MGVIDLDTVQLGWTEYPQSHSSICAHAIKDTIVKSIVPAVGAIASFIFSPALGIPLLGMACSFAATRIVLNLGDGLSPHRFDKVQNWATDVFHRHWIAITVTAVAGLIFSFVLHPAIGLAVFIPLGVLGGLHIAYTQWKALQDLTEEGCIT